MSSTKTEREREKEGERKKQENKHKHQNTDIFCWQNLISRKFIEESDNDFKINGIFKDKNTRKKVIKTIDCNT